MIHLGIYHTHLLRQQADVKCFMADEELLLDGSMDYEQVVGLSSEIKEKLFAVRPSTIVSLKLLIHYRMTHNVLQGAAKRMEGMTPTSLVYLIRHAKRTRHSPSAPDARIAQ